MKYLRFKSEITVPVEFAEIQKSGKERFIRSFEESMQEIGKEIQEAGGSCVFAHEEVEQ